MQDKYTGDAGDFGKICLLNEVIKQSGNQIKLGINWYYTIREEAGNNDGRHTSYLTKQNNVDEFRKISPELFDKLKSIVMGNRRKVCELEHGGVFSGDVIFYSTPVPFNGSSRNTRIMERGDWHKGALAALEQADIVFLDPDNGIKNDSRKISCKGAVKYVFPEEIKSYWDAGKSLIVYIHANRKKAQNFKDDILFNQKYLGRSGLLKVLKFKRFSVRYYIFMLQERHVNLINNAFTVLSNHPFDHLFGRYEL